MCLQGSAAIRLNDNTTYTFSKGETIFIPASMEDFALVPVEGNPQLLQINMPQLTDGPDLYLNYDEPEDEAHGSYKDIISDQEVYDDDDECHCGDDHHHCGCDAHTHHHHCSCGGDAHDHNCSCN